jgi:hypothetical protein
MKHPYTPDALLNELKRFSRFAAGLLPIKGLIGQWGLPLTRLILGEYSPVWALPARVLPFA